MPNTADASWMEIAKGEIGTSQYPVGQSNPVSLSTMKETNIRGYDDKVVLVLFVCKLVLWSVWI